ncbi:hypothetical protein FHS77_003057 [Paenochrobactrum gallinarii]|uniref:Addiction module toxin RelE n=1 Tax=Paenochrobactrum gallinarii TaxID=643673 RepID=A0A841M145_9HYPH|nr:hypothetical protein [Paenochrobactrum gallinarii]MBB6262482.1 hypothetical protein [Paenochrobactrum gallinarii]
MEISAQTGSVLSGNQQIYVFGGHHMPIFLITIFAKNEKADLTPKEQAAAVEMSKAIVSMWSNKQ